MNEGPQKNYSMDEIDNMFAGPAMDALVAGAMGWDLDEVAHKEFLSCRHHNTGIGMTGWEEYNEEQYRARMLRLAIPRYSTEDNHAFEIVDWLAKNGHSIRVITYAGKHRCQIFELDDTWGPNDFVSRTFKWINGGEGETRSLAICRATLKLFVQSH